MLWFFKNVIFTKIKYSHDDACEFVLNSHSGQGRPTCSSLNWMDCQQLHGYHGIQAYTRRQINLYRMFFADFSVNSQQILMKFCKDFFVSCGDDRDWREIVIKKY